MVLGVCVALWSASVLAETEAERLVNGWKALNGGSSIPAKVVYWRNGGICVLDLSTGTESTIRTQLDMNMGTPPANNKPILQSTSWGPYPCWSPDGNRIYFFSENNDWANWVMNADGSNPKRVMAVDAGGYWLCSWYDNNSVVYNAASTPNNNIVKVTIDANNNPVGTTNLMTIAPYGGSGRSYITASGNYLAYTDGDANAPYQPGGGHRSLVRNFVLGQEMEVIDRYDDACDICIKQDGSGTAVYCHAMHDNATCKSYQTGINPSTTLWTWTPISGGQVHFLRWSQDPNFICHIDNRALALADQKAWIRKVVVAGDQNLFLGYGIWGPDVWVGTPDITVPTVVVNKVALTGTVYDAISTPTEVLVNGTVHCPVSGGGWSTPDITFTSGVNIPVQASDASGNSRTVNINITVP